MKQRIAAVLAVLLFCVCAGCRRETSAPPALSADASASAAQAEPAPAPADAEPEADATEPPAPAPEPTPTPEPTPAPYDFAWPVPESAAVDPAWFSDAAFIGDSIMVSLHWYCVNTDQLPGVEWLCSGSLSAHNALWDISDESVHPEYNGVKTKLEDAVADCGAKNVYIMLGTNNISFGVDVAA